MDGICRFISMVQKGIKMKSQRFILIGVAVLVLLGCTVSSADITPGEHLRCPAWAQYNPESRCDMAIYDISISTQTLRIDLSEYSMVRMVVLNYDVIVVKSANIRIETDQGDEVVIEQSRLLPGAYVVFNESDELVAGEKNKAYFDLINPQGSESSSTALQFEYVRHARPTPVPTP